MRYKTNPKLTYEGRVVDGQKASLPGEIGQVCKNRVDTAFEQTPDMYLRTGDTANSTKETQRPCVDLKETNRSTTTLQGYDSNVQSAVKSITAPLLDTMKLSKKQYTTMHARPQGNFQNTNPSKLTIYDPNDVARTTIKETTVHDTRTGHLKGKNKTIMYNPDDIAKPTLRSFPSALALSVPPTSGATQIIFLLLIFFLACLAKIGVAKRLSTGISKKP